MKQSQIDKAIDSLEQEIQILSLACAKLKEQKAMKPARARKLKPATVADREGA